MSKWIAEFELEDGDTMPEHMDLEYKGARIDFYCKPQEPCDDCIRKQDVLSEIIRFSTEEGSSVECQQLYCDVNNMPSVTPIRPKGHWDIKDNMWWVCSACGCQTRMMKKYNVPNFCPACGAKMVEPQESEGKK